MNLESFDKVARLVHVNGIRVSKGGDLIASKDYEDPCRRNIYSATKSVTSLATGIALKEGLLSLEERLLDAFPEEVPSERTGTLPEARVRDLLTMGLGQEKSWLMGKDRTQIPEGKDWVREAFRIPFTHHPGERFLYSNVGPYLMGVLIEKRAGMSLRDYLAPRLFRPLGIPRPTWESDPKGRTFGAGGLFLSIDELDGVVCSSQPYPWNGCDNSIQLPVPGLTGIVLKRIGKSSYVPPKPKKKPAAKRTTRKKTTSTAAAKTAKAKTTAAAASKAPAKKAAATRAKAATTAKKTGASAQTKSTQSGSDA